MADSEQIRQSVKRAVEEAVHAHASALEAQLTGRLCEVLPALQGASISADSVSSLLAAVNSLQRYSTQADILSSLLQVAAGFAARSALFVLRSGSFVIWKAHGFSTAEIRVVTLDSTSLIFQRVIQERTSAIAGERELSHGFPVSVPHTAERVEALLSPLTVREKVAALLYTDTSSGSHSKLNASALECLVRFAGLWLEIVASRKAVATADLDMRAVDPKPMAAPALAAPEAYVPSGHNGDLPHPPEAAAFAPGMNSTNGDGEHVQGFSPPPSYPQSSGDDEVHRKARRFAKLLVDEIKLYNQQKVEEGVKNCDLYSRLKVEIQKSRESYQRRYGSSVAASNDYFGEELVRVLAGNDPALLGSEESS
jgi:hypothetical protein